MHQNTAKPNPQGIRHSYYVSVMSRSARSWLL